MADWKIQPKRNGRTHMELQGPEWESVRLSPSPMATAQEPARLPSPQERAHEPAFWHMPAALLFECIMLVQLYSMLAETIETVGIEINKFFKDDVLIGWLFVNVPQLTAREILAAMTAVFFVCLPILTWINLLQEQDRRSLGDRIVRVFLLFSSAFIIVGEVLLILHRVKLGASNPFMAQSGHEPAIAIFFSLLFVVVNLAAAYATASLYLARKQRRAR